MAGETYTHGHDASVLRSHRWRTVANSAAYAAHLFVTGADVLDIGCGPGTITVEIASMVAPGRTVGVDASPDVIAEATADATGSTATFAVGDAYALDFPDASFDVVHAHQVLQHLADPVAALREWKRVVKPGGAVVARDADYSAFNWYPESPLLDRWLTLYRAAARSNGGEPDAGRRLLAWAHEAGFDDVSATATVWCFASPEDRAWWGGTWADRISKTALADQLVANDLTTRQELEAVADGWRTWAGDRDGWFLVPHGEIVATV
jgi:SAM-dependent methyltransferase